MNPPTNYNRLAFEVDKQVKKAFVGYCKQHSKYLSGVLNKILIEFLKKEGVIK